MVARDPLLFYILISKIMSFRLLFFC